MIWFIIQLTVAIIGLVFAVLKGIDTFKKYSKKQNPEHKSIRQRNVEAMSKAQRTREKISVDHLEQERGIGPQGNQRRTAFNSGAKEARSRSGRTF
ncbi:MAG: hypothetical protein LBJ09_02665 [Clostridiales bacterium]|jgi:hypothetical protein|nr:hypothetical protein [Clostridiales bacterium]